MTQPAQTSQDYTYKALITLLMNLGYSRSQSIDIAFDADQNGKSGFFNDANSTEFVAIRKMGEKDYTVMQAQYADKMCGCWNFQKLGHCIHTVP